MAKAIRYIAAALLIMVGAGDVPVMAIELTGVTVTSTSRNRKVREIDADSARFNEDGTMVIAENLYIRMYMRDGQVIEARSEHGMVNISGDPDDPPDFDPANLTEQQVLEYARNFEEILYPGDFLMYGDARPVDAEMGGVGTLETMRLVWSEFLQLYLLPGEFLQTAIMEDKSEVSVTGGRAIINQDFDEFQYFGTDEKEASLEVVGPPVEEEED